MGATMKALRVSGLAVFLTAMGLVSSQELQWTNPGNYDYDAHFLTTPAEVAYPTGTAPGYDATLAHSAAFNPKVAGMDFQSDGKMFLLDWVDFGRVAKIYLLDGVNGNPETIKSTLIADSILEPMGLKLVDGELFCTAQDGLWKYTKSTVAGAKYVKSLVTNYAGLNKTRYQGFPIMFNTVYQAGSLYYSLGAYKNFDPLKNEGYVVKVTEATGVQEIIARGIRMPNGMAANPQGDLFFADNQGEFRPSSGIFHVIKGKHYGMGTPNGDSGNTGGAMTNFRPLPPKDSIQTAAVHIPYRPGSASVTNLFYLDTPPFNGQFLVGDNAYGVVNRVFMEKVKGVYQGAAIQFSGVLEAGIQSFAKGPDGTLYGGALGVDANGWNWLGKLTGLMKWKPNGDPFNSILSVSSQQQGFDLTFTEPLAANAANPDFYWVTSYYYQPTSAYGGAKLDSKKMKINRIRVSTDRRTVALYIEGLTAGRVYRIALSPSLSTEAGDQIWAKTAVYTLNVISDAQPLNPQNILSIRASTNSSDRFNIRGSKALIKIVEKGPFMITLADIRGVVMQRVVGDGPMEKEIDLPNKSGIQYLTLSLPAGRFTKEIFQ